MTRVEPVWHLLVGIQIEMINHAFVDFVHAEHVISDCQKSQPIERASCSRNHKNARRDEITHVREQRTRLGSIKII